MDTAKNQIKNIYPLSPMQMVMLYQALKAANPGEDAYFRQYVLYIGGELDFAVLQKSVNLLVERYDVLRTVFIWQKVKQPVQMVFKEKQIPVCFMNFSGLPPSEKEVRFNEFISTDRNSGFELSKYPLLRITVIKWADQAYRIVISNHHICMDGWCMGIVLGDLFEIYGGLLQNQPLNLAEVYPYSRYFEWLEKQDKLEAQNYWNQYLADYQQVASIPSAKTVINRAPVFKETSICIKKETTGKLELLARSNGLTLATVMQVLWGFVLQKYHQTNDVVFGTVVAGRPPDLAGVDRMVGLFINTVPVRIKYSNRVDFLQLAAQVQKAILMADKYHYLPLTDILAKTKFKQATLDHLMVYENYPVAGSLSSMNLTVERIETLEEPTSYDFNISVMKQDKLTLKLSYNSHVYHELIIETVKKHILETMDRIVGDTKSLFDDERYHQKLWDEIWESVKYAELSNVLGENRIFAEVVSIEEQGDFEFG